MPVLNIYIIFVWSNVTYTCLLSLPIQLNASHLVSGIWVSMSGPLPPTVTRANNLRKARAQGTMRVTLLRFCVVAVMDGKCSTRRIHCEVASNVMRPPIEFATLCLVVTLPQKPGDIVTEGGKNGCQNRPSHSQQSWSSPAVEDIEGGSKQHHWAGHCCSPDGYVTQVPASNQIESRCNGYGGNPQSSGHHGSLCTGRENNLAFSGVRMTTLRRVSAKISHWAELQNAIKESYVSVESTM